MRLSPPIASCLVSAIPTRFYNALIRRGIDQSDLYRRAATAVREPGLRTVLGENADQLDAMVIDLQRQVRQDGGVPAGHGTWRMTAWRMLAQLHRRTDSAWIGQLAREEASLLHVMECRLDHAPSGSEWVLGRQLQRLRAIHLDMCGLRACS